MCHCLQATFATRSFAALVATLLLAAAVPLAGLSSVGPEAAGAYALLSLGLQAAAFARSLPGAGLARFLPAKRRTPDI